VSRYWAKVSNRVVEQVIVAEESFFETFVDNSVGQWIETKIDGSIRKNYAGIGFTYDAVRDAFIAPKIFDSWVLNEDTCQWEPPTSYPNDGNDYDWDETTTSWVLIEE